MNYEKVLQRKPDLKKDFDKEVLKIKLEQVMEEMGDGLTAAEIKEIFQDIIKGM